MFELESLFHSGMSGDDILEELRRVGASMPDELWERLAVLVIFDESIYAEAIKDLATQPGFQLIVSNSAVRSFDAARGEFAVTATKRTIVLDIGEDKKTALAGFARRMLEWFDRTAPTDRLNTLALAIVAEPARAAKRFTELYDAADAAFDLAECARLLEILSARATFLTKALDDLWNSYDAYYRSRSLFVTDHYRSATYLKRSPRKDAKGKVVPSVESQFEAFWSSQEAWVLNVFGKGGSGKTMFIRWLIARRCLPRRSGQTPIAAARVDFDEIDLNSFERFPELVLGPIIVQLSLQLPGRPFQSDFENVNQYAAYLKRGTPPSHGSEATIRANMEAAIARLREELRQREVLIVFDTCEEPLIHRRRAFERLLNMFAGIHAECPGLRLLISGRYRLSEKGIGSHETATAVEVPPFAVSESRRYLIANREMKKGAVVNAIADRAEGNPFALSLFAELVAEAPKEWTAKAIRQAPSAELTYLLERVILRISEPAVRWLVRYAAVPRLLTRDFAEKVIGPWLPNHHGSDEANRFQDSRTMRRYDTKPPWPRAEFGDMSRTWDQLRAYASTPSWIIWDEETQSLKLQAEVAAPMRRLLRENAPLCATLHADAERYFRDRMKSHPGEHARAVAEAFFHAFHLRGAQADEEFRTAMQSKALESPSDRRWLAAMVLDLLDDDGKPLELRAGEPLVDPATILRARVDLALAAISIRLREGRLVSNSVMNAAKTLADQWGAIDNASPSDLRRAASRSELELIRTGFRYICRNQLVNSAPLRKLTSSGSLQLLARVLAARLHYERYFRGMRSTTVDFEKALAISQRIGSRDFPPSHVRYRLALYYLRTAQLEKATDLFARNFADTRGKTEWDDQSAEDFWRAIAGWRALGRWDKADRMCQALETDSRRSRSQPVRRFQLAHARAGLALDLGTTPPALAKPGAGAANMSHGAWFELTAEIHLRLLRIDEAEEALSEARGMYGAGLGDERVQVLEGAAAAAAGDNVAARRALRKPSNYWQLWLENAQGRARAGGKLPPASQLAKVGALASRVRTLATALAYGARLPLSHLLAGLAMLNDAARFAALVPFAETGEIWPGTLPPKKRLAKVLPKRPRPSSVAFVTQCLALAGARRFFGDSSGAIRLLDTISSQSDPLQQWRVERSRAAAGSYRATALSAALAGLIANHKDCTLLLVTAHIEAAEWAIRHKDSTLAAACRTFIEREIERAHRMGPAWRVRLALVDAGLAELRGEIGAARESLQEAVQKAKGQLERTHRGAAESLKRLEMPSSPAAGRPTWDKPLVPPVDEFTFEPARDDREIRIRGQLRSGGGFTQLCKPPPKLDLRQVQLLYDDLPEMVGALSKLDSRFLKFLSPRGARMRMPTGLLASLPWEYAAPQGEPLFYRSCTDDRENSESARWMQLILRELGYQVTVNAYAGHPAFLQALERFHAGGEVDSLHRHFLEALPRDAKPLSKSGRQGAIYINEMDYSWQRQHRRGYGAIGVTLATPYLPLRSLPWRKPELPQPPSVVHLAGAFSAADHESLSSRQVFYLDPGSEGSSPSSVTREFGTWTPRDFSAIMSILPQDIVRPLIILDALGPESAADAAREGLRRNQFCADVFTTGAARAVLGFGLIRHDRQSECLQTLVDGLREGLSIGEIHARLLGKRDFFHFPPALWTDDPHLQARIEF